MTTLSEALSGLDLYLVRRSGPQVRREDPTSPKHCRISCLLYQNFSVYRPLIPVLQK